MLSSVSTNAFNTVAGFAPPPPGGYASGKNLAKANGRLSSKVDVWLEEEIDDQSYDYTTSSAIQADLEQVSTPDSATMEAGQSPQREMEKPRMRQLLSLDTSVQLISADREALKRVQTFLCYPGQCGRKVRDTMEEIFIVLLQILLERNVKPAFSEATVQMRLYVALDHQDDSAVAPLVSFFELVHVGDTIQQMVQAYYDKEIASHIDRNDFLNAVVREKKLFESALDDAVASGLNTGIDLLMVKIELIIRTKHDPRDFCPEVGRELDLAPTQACSEVISCLESHCSMLKGSTDKQIMEIFNQEVGMRLHTIICKHLKKCIISIEGGFQVISDLNAYHNFIQSFRQPTLTSYFTALKMVGGLYIINSPKDLGQLARDVHRFDGTLRSEDLYEFIQRRTDWKKIERAVDKEIYGLRKEDCLIS